eukprot:scaffold757_cov246-Pinguiococcus_pyrenoidosus.AAC.7
MRAILAALRTARLSEEGGPRGRVAQPRVAREQGPLKVVPILALLIAVQILRNATGVSRRSGAPVPRRRRRSQATDRQLSPDAVGPFSLNQLGGHKLFQVRTTRTRRQRIGAAVGAGARRVRSRCVVGVGLLELPLREHDSHHVGQLRQVLDAPILHV